jgi:hypothetical protein
MIKSEGMDLKFLGQKDMRPFSCLFVQSPINRITIACKNILIGFLASFFFFIPTCSANGHIYLGASVAASFAQQGTASPQISYFSGDIITDAYPHNNNNASTAIFGINAGYEFSGAHWNPSIAFGLGIYSNLVDYNYQGQVIETAAGDASTTLYNYSYNINSKRLMAEVQLSWLVAKLSPFLNFGVGTSWNRMNNYHEMQINSTSYPPFPPFQTRTNDNIAYQAGIGLSTAFNFASTKSDDPKERISLGYRYVNLGTTAFRTRGSVYPFVLNTGLLKTNDVYLSYTHLF